MASEIDAPKYVIGIPGVKLEEVQRTVPAGEAPPLAINEKLKVIGKPTTRLDGRQKVTGAAKYTADVNLPGMLYAKMITATITAGKITSIDTSATEAMPGVKAVHILGGDQPDAKFPTIRYAGQPIGAVAATSPDIARDALAAIKIEYESVPWVVDMEKAKLPDAPPVYATQVQMGAAGGGGGGTGGRQQRGNVLIPRMAANTPTQEQLNKLFADSDAVVEGEYHTQVQTHSPLETHGVVADWKPDLLTVYASTQGTNGVRDELAQVFNMPGKVRVITEFMGGGFGAKFGAGAWGALATHLSRKTGTPVKLMCDRKEQHLCTGNRPDSSQKLRIGAKKDGTLTAIYLVNYGTAGIGTGASVARPIQQMYVCPVKVTEEYDVFTNAGPGTSMRAPGSPPGAFALEQAMDELAEKLGMDPVALREKIDDHEARKEERRVGIETFGWKNRHAPGTDPGPVKRGMGFAQSVWGRNSSAGATCEVRISKDGSVEAMSAVQDIGGGIRTALAQCVAEELGLKVTDIIIRIGDTNFPQGAPSGGSVTTNAMTPVARNAAYQAKLKLLAEVAPTLGVQPDDLVMADGKVSSKSDPSKTMPFKNVAARLSVAQVSAQAVRARQDYANINGIMGGVQFAEVSVDVQTGIIKVDRMLVVQDCGRPINPLAIQSQLNGGIIQGLSYALYEDRILDRQTGFMVNPNLQQYKIAMSREMPIIETILIEQYAARSSTDAAGIGEPAVVPTAAAIANAVYNAIGVRLKRIPMTPKVVLAALAQKVRDEGRGQRAENETNTNQAGSSAL